MLCRNREVDRLIVFSVWIEAKTTYFSFYYESGMPASIVPVSLLSDGVLTKPPSNHTCEPGTSSCTEEQRSPAESTQR